MATNFPTSLDSYTDVADGDTIQISTTNNQQDAIEALEAKVGIDSSAVTSSHDYKIGAIETILGSASTADLTKLHGVTATAAELNTTDGFVDASFRAYMNADMSDVTGDGSAANITGAVFTERFDTGSNFSDGTFTAPVTSNKYKFGITLKLCGLSSSHDDLELILVTTGGNYTVYHIDPYTIAYSTGATYHYLAVTQNVDNIPMTATDTAYWRLIVNGGTKITGIKGATIHTEVWGGLSL